MSPEDTTTGQPAAAQPVPTPAERKEAATAPSAAKTTTATADKSYRSDEDWNGIPLFKCPFCPHALAIRESKGNGEDAIEFHILSKIEAGDSRHLPALDH